MKQPAARAALAPEPAGDDPVDEDELPEVPKRVQLSGSPIYVVEQRLGKGGFGQVCRGTRLVPRKVALPTKPNQVAIKFEHHSSKGCPGGGPPNEWAVYQALGETHGIPRLYFKGSAADFYIMVMELLGPSLWDVWNGPADQSLSEQYVACVAVEALTILEHLHAKGYVHGDVKPENFLLGAPGGPRAQRLYLVDLGLAVRYRGASMHNPYDQRPDDFRGTIRYASVHAHLGRAPSRRDDLESLAYTLMFLLNGRLPWQGFQGENKGFMVCKTKMGTSAEQLCRMVSEPFRRFTDAVISLSFEEEPAYAALRALFEPLLGATASRPIAVDTAAVKVGQKRGRAELEALDVGPDGVPRKKARAGFVAQQWITIYNKHTPMKQRYHYNVSTCRLDVHVTKGRADGLHVSSVGAAGELWAVIMDAGTQFTAQVHYVAQRQFLPKDWIMEQWDAGFDITAIAGSSESNSLVVMSKGARFSQQSYKVSEALPYEWIRKKWREGFYITSLATAGTGGGGNNGRWQWAVVMSRHAGFAKQCIELDFQYPSEGIHRRWDAGYRITACAATPHQAAFVLSIPTRQVLDETQETLRTSTFPSTHVQEKWAKDLYISCVAYGRTTV